MDTVLRPQLRLRYERDGFKSLHRNYDGSGTECAKSNSEALVRNYSSSWRFVLKWTLRDEGKCPLNGGVRDGWVIVK